MANIMINETCNQRCPYCFASEFVNKKPNNISFKNFIKAKKFILNTNNKKRGVIGIIGGEPTLHPKFSLLLFNLKYDRKVTRATIFTNGVYLDKYFPILKSEKFSFLININSPNDVGLTNYNRTIDNLDYVVNKMKNGPQRVTIGLNIYSDKVNYDFFIDLAKKYRFSLVRLSVVVPPFASIKNGLDHFRKLKFKVLEIAKTLLVNGIKFRFDCNVPPKCIWDNNELNDLKIMGLSTNDSMLVPLCNSKCHPVIDILPNLEAIRCFGLSDKTKISIDKFNNIDELYSHYIDNFDNIFLKEPIDNICKKCELFPEKCYGGCLGNRKGE